MPLDAQLGPGVLDLEGAARARGGRGRGDEPALDKSWYVPSSTYARPDPSGRVRGTIELRRPDGAPRGGASMEAHGRRPRRAMHTPLGGRWAVAAAVRRAARLRRPRWPSTSSTAAPARRARAPGRSDARMANGELEATSGACTWAVPARPHRRRRAARLGPRERPRGGVGRRAGGAAAEHHRGRAASAPARLEGRPAPSMLPWPSGGAG